MRRASLLAAGILALLATGAFLYLFLVRSGGEPRGDEEVALTTSRSSGSGGAADLGGGKSSPSNAALPSPRRSALEALLARFDRAWAAPKGLQGRPYYLALRERDGVVDDLAREVATLGPDVVADIQVHLEDGSTSYPRRTFLVTSLAHLGSEEALELLAGVVVEGKDWRLRFFAFGKLVASESPEAMEVALGVLPRLDDPRLLLPVLKAGWDEGPVERAYRKWLGAVPSRARNQSYTLIAKAQGAWIGGVLREVASSGSPTQERAGAIQALAILNEEGTLSFLRDLLWIEEDPTIIKALVGAIRRVGKEEAAQILREYLAAAAPADLRGFVQRAADAPTQMKPMPAGGGEDGGPRMGTARVEDPERLRRLIGE